jgi:hypothetical protein
VTAANASTDPAVALAPYSDLDPNADRSRRHPSVFDAARPFLEQSHPALVQMRERAALELMQTKQEEMPSEEEIRQEEAEREVSRCKREGSSKRAEGGCSAALLDLEPRLLTPFLLIGLSSRNASRLPTKCACWNCLCIKLSASWSR